MPGFDGKGPEGRGPMTGAGLGFCILKKNDTADEPVTGYAGLAGEPVSDCRRSPRRTRRFTGSRRTVGSNKRRANDR
jgi:hypothetical protein